MQEIEGCPICGSTQRSPFLHTRDFHYSQEEFTLQRCQQCALIMTSPQPEKEKLPFYYSSPDYLSHSSTATHLIGRLYRLARQFTIRRKAALVARFQEPGTLLDFGCGTGEFLVRARHEGWKTFGVEPAEPARKAAAAKLPDVFHDIESVPLQSCNAITLWHVLEHVPDLRQTMADLVSRLTPNGTVFVAVPNIASHDSRHYAARWAGLDVPRHLWHFTRRSMERLLQQHALTLTRILPMKLDAYYVSLLSEKYRDGDRLTTGGYLRAMRTAVASNRAAARSGEYSSLIYVARK